VAKSIYPPLADSNGNSGILPPPFGRNPASMPFLSCKFFASQKTYETIVTGLHAGHPCRFSALGFCFAKPGNLPAGPASLPARSYEDTPP
jgi:hypothetical protein